jgi:hypothetical protein
VSFTQFDQLRHDWLRPATEPAQEIVNPSRRAALRASTASKDVRIADLLTRRRAFFPSKQ